MPLRLSARDTGFAYGAAGAGKWRGRKEAFMPNASDSNNRAGRARAKTASVDRRVRKTKKALQDCLIRLLKTKKLQDITVREISEMADINRGTFYLHYKDVYDLVSQIENEFADEFDQILQHYSAEELTENPSLFFNEFYPFIIENRELITALFSENGSLNFENRVKTMIGNQALHKWMNAQGNLDNTFLAPFFAYMVSGCVGLIHYWLDSGMKETPQEMSAMTSAFISKGLHALQ